MSVSNFKNEYYIVLNNMVVRSYFLGHSNVPALLLAITTVVAEEPGTLTTEPPVANIYKTVNKGVAVIDGASSSAARIDHGVLCLLHNSLRILLSFAPRTRALAIFRRGGGGGDGNEVGSE